MLTCGCPESMPEYEEETGFVETDHCPVCSWRPGDPEPDIVTEGHDALTEHDKEAYTFASSVGILIVEADASSGHSTKQGLGPADFLLLAEGHLRKASGQLDSEPPPVDTYSVIYAAWLHTVWAAGLARKAIRLLKEEPCKQSKS